MYDVLTSVSSLQKDYPGKFTRELMAEISDLFSVKEYVVLADSKKGDGQKVVQNEPSEISSQLASFIRNSIR